MIHTVELMDHSFLVLSQGELEVWIRPDDGMNICKITYKGLPIVQLDTSRAERGQTYGMPLLFPTPNRVRGNRFEFDGLAYEAVMHGLVRNSAFEVINQHSDMEKTWIVARLSMNRDENFINKFPFKGYLQVTVRLCSDCLEWFFELVNESDRRLPFGIGLHPFFVKYPEAALQCYMRSAMMMDEDKIPTGDLSPSSDIGIPAGGIRYVEELILDHVLTNWSGKAGGNQSSYHELALIDMGMNKIQMAIEGTEAFSHLVVYVPGEGDFFCVEPQTCSTDCHNLYNKGYMEASGLLTVEPGEKSWGGVRFVFSQLEGETGDE